MSNDAGFARILTNIAGLGRACRALPEACRVQQARSGAAFLGQCLDTDLVVIDNDNALLALACAAKPFGRFRLLSVDLILRPPEGPRRRAAALAKSLLLRAVDRFALYFKAAEGYQRHYGIGPDRRAYLPFKINGVERPDVWPEGPSADDAVLCAGRTLRDVDTFVAAMRLNGLPGILLQQSADQLERHGTRAWTGELPPNVRLVVGGDDLASFVRQIHDARVVVIPRFRGDIAATGISTYLTAMALGRCVVISRGPGADDVLTDQAAFVEPEDPADLAATIETLWRDDALRLAMAARGRRYAEALGGEDRLLGDILRLALDLLGRSSSAGRPEPFRSGGIP